jgi:anti-anti-sigma factor
MLSHLWEVQNVEDGILVKIRYRDLDLQSLSVMAEELFDLVQESDRSKLYLDFGEVDCLPSLAVGKLFALDRKLRQTGGRLVLWNVHSVTHEVFEAEGWPEEPVAE